MAPTYRCKCLSHRCCDVIDPITGENGVAVPTRTLSIHKKHDNVIRQQELLTLAEQAQASVLQENDARILRSLTSCDPPVPPTIHKPRYRRQFIHQIIADLSNWKEGISLLSEEVGRLGLPCQNQSLDDIRLSIEACQRVEIACGDIVQSLRVVRHGSYRNQPSIQVLLGEADKDIATLKSHLASTLARWQCALRLADAEVSRNNVYDTSANFASPFEESTPIIQVVSLMVVTCHILLGLPRRGCVWLLSMCAYLAEITMHQSILLFKTRGAIFTIKHFTAIFKNFPKRLRAATDTFQLDGKSVVYAVCCKCHECYPPKEENGIPVYPSHCTSKRYGYRCGEVLVRPQSMNAHKINVPIKKYVVFDFKDWLSRLMSREGVEEQMDGAWKRMDGEGTIDDIFQGSVIREFMGPNGRTHFSLAGPNEETGRYLFSLGCDFFNPLRNLANGKRVSVGIIAIICLNLPMSIRYKPENIFLGAIIPGPKEPPLDSMNPYLRPFVDMFIQLWEGVRFSRTALHERGRWILCALVAVICDLPASRKVGGFSSCNHEYFCSVCWCTKTEHTYEDLNYQSWKWRTNQECRNWANLYRCAASAKSASSFFDRSGLRWSELLRLPYFDPTKHLVVDPMHNLFLGLLKEHFQHILGYYTPGVKPTKAGSNDGKIPKIYVQISPSALNPLPSSPTVRKGIRKLKRRLSESQGTVGTQEPQRNTLIRHYMGSGIQLQSLIFVTKALNLISSTVQMDGRDPNLPFSPALRKVDLAALLANWRLLQSSEPLESPVGRNAGHVFTDAEIEALWHDIETMVKPSWATSVPNNISSGGAKLKSDQWRSIGSVFLPVTLIRLWSDTGDTSTDGADRKQLLHLTMLLCSAVSVITSRSVSANQAGYYLGYITEYRKELKRMFPYYEAHPNHHMAMHLGEFLIKYGPVHGWWTFPFERMIGRLQRIQTNYKIGEYEYTIGHSWTQSSNLLALFSKSSCPEAIKNCFGMFKTLTKSENRNILADIDNEGPLTSNTSPSLAQSRLPRDVIEALREAHGHRNIPDFAERMSHVTVDGVSYCVNDQHEGNSGVFKKGSSVPFSIVDIVRFPDGDDLEKLWFVVKSYKNATVARDPYSMYPHIRAKLWSSCLSTELEAIPLSEIDTHYAMCRVSWEGSGCIVVVSLSKTHIVW